MARSLRNPDWIDSRLLTTSNMDDLPESFFSETRDALSRFRSDHPLVSIVIPALNEEFTILRTLHSLSRNETTYPVEIIVVNNNSTDRTQWVLDRLNVKSVFQPVPGWGPARQAGQEKALGKYILSADADSFYPPRWLQLMTTALLRDNVACVYGGYSYLGTREYPRWKFFFYESCRDVIRAVRHIKRPHFNARGLNMGYPRELGLRKGYVYRKVKGEDGRMCFDLMQQGKVVRLSSDETQVWTLPRYLKADGGLLFSFLNHGLLEFKRFKNYFSTFPSHDTHTSVNSEPIALHTLGKAVEVKVVDEPMAEVRPRRQETADAQDTRPISMNEQTLNSTTSKKSDVIGQPVD